MAPTINILDTEEIVAEHLAKYVADESDKFCKRKGSFTIALTGGALIHTLRKLVQPPYIESVEWSKWHVFWADEKVVSLDDDQSNYKLANDAFLSKVPIPPANIHPIEREVAEKGEPAFAAFEYAARLSDLVDKKIIEKSDVTGFPKFDLLLLGMGPNCHVAAIFPEHILFYEESMWVGPLYYSPMPPLKRITFTFPVINSSSDIALVVTGPEMANEVRMAMKGPSGSAFTLPVQVVSPEGELTWFLDKAAASEIPA